MDDGLSRDTEKIEEKIILDALMMRGKSEVSESGLIPIAKIKTTISMYYVTHENSIK